jgi:hypothetical protein
VFYWPEQHELFAQQALHPTIELHRQRRERTMHVHRQQHCSSKAQVNDQQCLQYRHQCWKPWQLSEE